MRCDIVMSSNDLRGRISPLIIVLACSKNVDCHSLTFSAPLRGLTRLPVIRALKSD